MNTEHVPKKYSVADQQQWYEKMAERAFLAKFLILTQSLYFILITTSFDTPRDRSMLGIEGLPVGPAFCAAGLVGLIVLAFPGRIRLVAFWLLLVGLACVGRTFSVLFESTDAFTLNERLKVTGWIVQWLGSLVAIVQILAARALRGRRVWTG